MKLNMWRHALAAIATLGIVGAANAVVTLPTSNYAGDQDGSSRYFGLLGLYGIAGDYEVDVNSSHQLLTASAESGTWTVQPGNTANTTPWLMSQSPYPTGATPITASATGTTAATTATLTNVSGHTTYICGFSIRANATAAATGNATVTGTITATMNFTQWTAPAASGVGVTEEIMTPCVPASAVSTSIAVVSAAPGTGGVVSVTAWGFSI